MEKETGRYPESCYMGSDGFAADIRLIMAFLGWILYDLRNSATTGKDSKDAMDGIRESTSLLLTDRDRNSWNRCGGEWSLSAGEKRIQIQEIERNGEIYIGTIYTAFLVHQHGIDGGMQHSLPLGMV